MNRSNPLRAGNDWRATGAQQAGGVNGAGRGRQYAFGVLAAPYFRSPICGCGPDCIDWLRMHDAVTWAKAIVWQDDPDQFFAAMEKSRAMRNAYWAHVEFVIAGERASEVQVAA